MQTYRTVDAYIAATPKAVQSILKELRSVITQAAPKANERISYGMPFYEYGGSGYKGRLLYFAAFKKHISLFITPRYTKTVPKPLRAYHVSKATYRFPLDQPFPFGLIKQTVTALVREHNRNSAEQRARAS